MNVSRLCCVFLFLRMRRMRNMRNGVFLPSCMRNGVFLPSCMRNGMFLSSQRDFVDVTTRRTVTFDSRRNGRI